MVTISNRTQFFGQCYARFSVSQIRIRNERVEQPIPLSTYLSEMRKKFLFLLLIMGALALLLIYGPLSINWLINYAGILFGQLSIPSVLIIIASTLYIYLGIRFFYRHVNSVL